MSAPPPPPTKLVFVDIETTGLDPERHEAFEIALIVRDSAHAPPKQMSGGASDYEKRRRQEEIDSWAYEHKHHYWLVPTHLETADPGALRLNGYYSRIPAKNSRSGPTLYKEHQAPVARMALHLAGAHLVGANPNFDARFLEALFRRNKLAPAWHYHLIDVEMLALAATGQKPPFKSDDLYKALEIEIPKGRHTAMADAELARTVYDKVIHGR